ncbi:MBL fold metallo-hydrolase [Paracoccus onubensis]|uniref:MBL fold metallo-hydrolase n=1 Tax=Paracoccus onubensis TaxID=1675788 RepID=A0A418SWY6_9RHOB|nr:MBL fold metallo-hydrolase [Paracoccus onubensis]
MQTRRSILKSTASLGLLAALPSAAFAKAPLTGTQAPGFYRMRLGDLEITALSDGTVALPMAQIYQGLSAADIGAYLKGHFINEKSEVSVNAYLVNTEERLVLIDAGTGDIMGPSLGKLVANIEAAGYRADQIDDVILTHVHADHSGGLTTADGARIYENAVLHVNATEAAFWLEASPEAVADTTLGPQIVQAHANIDPYIAADRFSTFDNDASPLPGIGSVHRPGHTPGHSAIVLKSDGEKLVIWGDIAHGDALQFDQPEVTVSFDVDQPRAAATRALAFAEAADQAYLVAGAHHAFPGIGHIRRDDTNYDWVPLSYRANY